MNLDQRLQQLRALHHELAALSGLGAEDLRAIADAAKKSEAEGKLDAAAKLYGALALLEPGHPSHGLDAARLEQKAGRTQEALAAIDRYLDVEQARSHAQLAKALELRATLREKTDPKGAAVDRETVKQLSLLGGGDTCR